MYGTTLTAAMMAGEAVAVLEDLVAAAQVAVALADLGKQQKLDNFVLE